MSTFVFGGYMWHICVFMCSFNSTYHHVGKEKTALTGHPRHSLFHCQAAPSLLLLSPSLEGAHQRRVEAGTGDLSLQREVPLQAPVTALPPPDTLKNNKETLVHKNSQIREGTKNLVVFSVQAYIQYLSLDWLLGGGWRGAGPLLVEKKHQIGWVPRMGPMNARGRLELTGAPHLSTLQRKKKSIYYSQSRASKAVTS